jgi:hypothetical protein
LRQARGVSGAASLSRTRVSFFGFGRALREVRPEFGRGGCKIKLRGPCGILPSLRILRSLAAPRRGAGAGLGFEHAIIGQPLP